MNKSKDKKIQKDMNLSDIIIKYPQTAQVLLDYGLHCVGCAANIFDTVEGGARIHGMSDEEIEEMIESLNAVANR